MRELYELHKKSLFGKFLAYLEKTDGRTSRQAITTASSIVHIV